MGYSYCDSWKNISDVKNEILSNSKSIVAHASYGNEFYALVEVEGGKNYINLFLINGRGGQFGYNSISEDAYPYYFNCPEKLLKLSESDDTQSVEWRKACRQFKVNKKIAKDLVLNAKLGDVINTDFGLVTFQFIIKPSSGAFAAKNKDGKTFRYYPKNVVL